jgi:hypothetical protein
MEAEGAQSADRIEITIPGWLNDMKTNHGQVTLADRVVHFQLTGSPDSTGARSSHSGMNWLPAKGPLADTLIDWMIDWMIGENSHLEPRLAFTNAPGPGAGRLFPVREDIDAVADQHRDLFLFTCLVASGLAGA